MRPPQTFKEGPPEAVVERTGRWLYRVYVSTGGNLPMCYGPDGYGWLVLGHGRARRKAARVLARYKRREGWSQAPEVIR